MRKLIAVTYDTEFKAEEVRLQFLKMQSRIWFPLRTPWLLKKNRTAR